MNLFIRLIFLTLFVELGLIYSIQAEAFLAKYDVINVQKNTNAVVFLPSINDGTHKNQPYELLTENQLTEINEEDVDDELVHYATSQNPDLQLSVNSIFSHIGTLLLKEDYPSLHLFILFHSWKFHI